MLYGMTYTSAQLAYYAHKPYNYLNKLMAEKSLIMIKRMKRSMKIGINSMKITNE